MFLKTYPCSGCGNLRTILYDGLCLPCSDKKEIVSKQDKFPVKIDKIRYKLEKTMCTGCSKEGFYGSIQMCDACICQCGGRKRSPYDTKCQECEYISEKLIYVQCSSCNFSETSSCRTISHLPQERWKVCWECKERPSIESKFMHKLCPTCGHTRECISKEEFFRKK